MPTTEEDTAQKLNTPLRMASEHFILCFTDRNPRHGKGVQVRGVRDRALLYCYIDALERLYTAMTTPPFNRQPPKTGPDGKTYAYVFHIPDLLPWETSPFMLVIDHTQLDEYIPYIGLPCRINHPSFEARHQWAAASAVHEATHAFNETERPIFDRDTKGQDLHTKKWRWVNEGMAIFMENWVMRGNCDYLSYMMNWNDMPHVSLDDPSAQYQSGMFIRYLAKKINPGFISKVWMESERTEIPMEALARFSQVEGHTFLSADPNVRDLFASGYCLDSYFLFDPKSDGFAPEVYARYGERAVTQSFELDAGTSESIGNRLDHLACNYYRFYLDKRVSTVRVEFKPDSPLLKAELAVVTRNLGRGSVTPLKPQSAGNGALVAELTELTPQDIDHLVLVVTNCGTRGRQHNPDIPHDDGLSYTVEVTAGS